MKKVANCNAGIWEVGGLIDIILITCNKIEYINKTFVKTTCASTKPAISR